MKNFTKKIRLAFMGFSVIMISVNAGAQTNNTLDFDGTNDYVEIPYNSSLFPDTVSIQVSAKVAGHRTYQSILTCRGTNTGFALYSGGSSDDRWKLFIGTGGQYWTSYTGPAVTFGEWTILTIIIKNDKVSFYVNQDSLTTLSSYVPNSSYPMRVGAGSTETSPSLYFYGQIDELRFWDRILTPAEIGMNEKLTGTEPGLLAYYDFDQGTPGGNNTAVTSLNDLTVNNNDGTLYNMTLNGSTSNWVSSSLVLPVNLTNFTGVKKDGGNLLKWSTASEQNSNRFEVQRSETGTNFNTIGTIPASANCNNIRQYQFSDNQLLSGASVYYYRLKMIDIDGNFKYSPVVFIKNNSIGIVTIYPNPVKEKMIVNATGKTFLNTEASLTDVNGEVLLRIFLNQPSTQINLSQYSKGIYILRLSDGSTTKIIKE